MAFDEKLAHRVRCALEGTQGMTERRMFGGLVFLVNGHLCCGVDRSELFVRLDRAGCRACCPAQVREAVRAVRAEGWAVWLRSPRPA